MAFPADQTIAESTAGNAEIAAAAAEEPAAAAPEGGEPKRVEVDIESYRARYAPVTEELAQKVASYSGQNVRVVVRGTPPDMVPARSFVLPSPIPTYMPYLKGAGVWIPYDLTWQRLQSEVFARMLEFVAREKNPMTPEEAAKWAQDEAQAIIDGRK